MSITVPTTRQDHRIAWLTALAITIHIAESALPSPLPGIKPGLANVVTIVALVQYGWGTAAWVALLRVLIGSLLIGTFLSPTFLLSLAGAAGCRDVPSGPWAIACLPQWPIWAPSSSPPIGYLSPTPGCSACYRCS